MKGISINTSKTPTYVWKDNALTWKQIKCKGKYLHRKQATVKAPEKCSVNIHIITKKGGQGWFHRIVTGITNKDKQ